MRTTWYEPGDWNALCDVCGFKFKASQLKERWDGLHVCESDWEQRHPQELIRPAEEAPALPWTRPEGTDVSVGPSYSDSYETAVCTTQGSASIPDYAIPDCATPDTLIPGLL